MTPVQSLTQVQNMTQVNWQDSSTEPDQVMRGEADMAAADLTITAAREEVLDFTHPFMYIGLGVLYTKNTR